MSVAKIRSALVTQFQAQDLFSNETTAWENLPFVPPSSGPWCGFVFVPAQPTIATLGPNGYDSQDGFLQLDLNYPPGNGDKAVGDKYDTIKEAFTAGTKLSYQGQEVSIRSCGRSQGRLVGAYWRVSVTIFFYAQIQR